MLQEENLTPYVEGALGRWYPVTKKAQQSPFWQENRHKLQQKGQPDNCDAQPSAMPPEPTGAESDG